ncbi:ATP-binding protein [Yoonia sp. 208BN28-4]|uniref:ATP-binding protein n=1 Tax=Yoonia sp. 208BN28-4 TaxID=3126505 RepID=UPI0030B4C2F9
MFFRWLKTYMPRSLYGRAALILILPVLLLQLLVSVVFVQRHFEGVTRAMTRAMNIELQFVVDTVNATNSAAEAAAALDAIAAPLELNPVYPATAAPEADIKPFIDLTGWTVIGALRDGVPEVRRISLADRRQVDLWLETERGIVELSFRRSRVSASNPHQLLVIMVVIGALMTTVAYFFLRNQLRPIKRMADAATAYGKGRIAPYHPGGATEVRAAGTAFLDMRNRIERQTQSRTMMLSGVSHDLRTPLTRLRLGLSLLDEEDAAPLLQDVDDMQRLLDAFLDFARSDAGDKLEPVVPHDLLTAVLEDAQRMDQPLERGTVEGRTDEIALKHQAIRRALDNLVGNALRYGTKARIGLNVSDRAVRFVIEDDGPGISPDQREDALRPFVRLDPARNQNKGSGVGLGLSIVSDIARSHGGVLRLSESPDMGGLKAELVLAR